MSRLIVPTQYKKEKDKLFVAQVFMLNEQGQIVSGIAYPPPTNGKIKGAFLSQIRANLDGPIDTLLQGALQNGESKLLFRVTEFEKFQEELRKATTMNALRAKVNEQSNAPQSEVIAQTGPANDERNTSHE
jgi:hypothetical protein